MEVCRITCKSRVNWVERHSLLNGLVVQESSDVLVDLNVDIANEYSVHWRVGLLRCLSRTTHDGFVDAGLLCRYRITGDRRATTMSSTQDEGSLRQSCSALLAAHLDVESYVKKTKICGEHALVMLRVSYAKTSK